MIDDVTKPYGIKTNKKTVVKADIKFSLNYLLYHFNLLISCNPIYKSYEKA